ncbi:20110_t:CDS:2 [Cetraspora pellucida]|uniref:20110_t:CDS:1 n=1 Tax=Cetraspora pellucida TaxID=1433469 RepID=A0A9N9K4E6_9GLOM|nr:20110_t:CDS:2 [Cetraspora pellucida]
MSKINEETWMISPNNTNITESAYALIITIDSEDLSENDFKETSKVNNLEYQE